jgi:Ca2+-binding RTX toxin-like protein
MERTRWIARMSRRSSLLVAALGGFVMLAVTAAPAGAAQVADVQNLGVTLVFADDPGADANLQVTQATPDTWVFTALNGQTLMSGSPAECTAGPANVVTCTRSGLKQVAAGLGDGTDQIVMGTGPCQGVIGVGTSLGDNSGGLVSGPKTIFGGEKNDFLFGATHAASNDTIHGCAGDDEFAETPGNDTYFGEGGNDQVNGPNAKTFNFPEGLGDDVFDMGPGDDLVPGGEGADVVLGGIGNDNLTGDAPGQSFADALDGQDGNDVAAGGSGDDIVKGSAGRDALSGDDGNDKVKGGTGKDRLSGGLGNDTLKGGAGKDKLIGGAGKDRLICGPGKRDTALGTKGDKVSPTCEIIR